jgi:hypothetical protein
MYVLLRHGHRHGLRRPRRRRTGALVVVVLC